MKKRRKRSYPLGSTAINKTAWFYQEPTGLHIIAQHFNKSGQYICTVQTMVPWRAVSSSLSLHRRIQAERRVAKR